MSEERVACPQCGQDWLVRVRLVHLRKVGIICPECDALWLTADPRPESFVDYGTFMRSNGRTDPEQHSEVEFLEPLTRTR
jgi:predicted  nucleic acid-binding Zn ribbon protein